MCRLPRSRKRANQHQHGCYLCGGRTDGECGSERSALVDVPVGWREICDGRKHVIVFGDMPPSEGSHDGTDGITVAYTWCVPGRVPSFGAEADITGSFESLRIRHSVRNGRAPLDQLGRWRRSRRAGVRATGGTYATWVMVASGISRPVGPDRRDISCRGCTGGALPVQVSVHLHG